MRSPACETNGCANEEFAASHGPIESNLSPPWPRPGSYGYRLLPILQQGVNGEVWHSDCIYAEHAVNFPLPNHYPTPGPRLTTCRKSSQAAVRPAFAFYLHAGSTMSPAFDYPGSLKRFGNDQQLFCEMVGFFFDDAPKWLEALRTGLAQNDVLQIQRAAHTLKGMSANFGASRATAAAAQIEQHVGMGNLSAASRALPLLEDAIEELERALSEHRVLDEPHPALPTNGLRN